MPPRDPAAYIWDVLDACKTIEECVRGADLNSYMKDKIRRLAIERLLIQIGEAVGRLAKVDAAMAAELGDVRQIVAFRNILVHAYFALDHAKVWDAVTTDVPALRTAVDRVWARFAPLYDDEEPIEP